MIGKTANADEWGIQYYEFPIIDKILLLSASRKGYITFSADGLPLINYGRIGLQTNPIAICNLGLDSISRFARGDSIQLPYIRKIAEWLVQNVDETPSGGCSLDLQIRTSSL